MNPAEEVISLTDSIHTYLSQLDHKLNDCMKPSITAFPFDIEHWDEVERVQDSLVEEYIPEVTQFLDQAYASLTELDTCLSHSDQQACLTYHRSLVQPYFLQTQFVRRAFDRPLGYAGDYVTNEMLFENKRDGASPLARILSHYALNTGPARAHRGRMQWAHHHLWQHMHSNTRRPVRILSFACGPERILREFVAQGGTCEITLCDHDGRALEYCRREFKKIMRKTGSEIPVHYVELSAYALLKDPAAIELIRQPVQEGQYDVILVLGLLDYLQAQAFTKFLDILATLLKPGGDILLTNVNRNNPWRSFMEYIGEWRVISRDKDEFRDLVIGNPPLFSTTELIPDASGINLYFAGRSSATSQSTHHMNGDAISLLTSRGAAQ
jgi:extracellular factor (EF) 3-hydroxypalmitic acid methyl ester biosynthesis protein